MTANAYETRMHRAKALVQRYPFAKEVLDFYLHLASFQKHLYGKVAEARPAAELGRAYDSLRERIDPAIILPEMRGLLSVIEERAPGRLAAFAKELKGETSASWAQLVTDFCVRGGTGREFGDPWRALIGRVLTQPSAELLAKHSVLASPPGTRLSCPLCAGLPVAGVLRPEGDGGKRFLICAFCGTEWEFRRILCAYCGETREGQLPVFVAEELPHVRMECCDTCRKFLRTVDLTKDGNAVAVVDDLAAIPLTLWAHEHGYERIASNLLET